MKYDCQLAGVSARPPDRVELIGAGSRLRDRPQLRLRANKLPSPNHCGRRDFLLVFTNLLWMIGWMGEDKQGGSLSHALLRCVGEVIMKENNSR